MKNNNILLVLGVVSLLIIITFIQNAIAQRYIDFELTVRLIGDKERNMPDYTVRTNGETQYIYGEEFEDDGKAKVQFYLTDVDRTERVCITDERYDSYTCKRFNTNRGAATVNFYVQ